MSVLSMSGHVPRGNIEEGSLASEKSEEITSDISLYGPNERFACCRLNETSLHFSDSADKSDAAMHEKRRL